MFFVENFVRLNKFVSLKNDSSSPFALSGVPLARSRMGFQFSNDKKIINKFNKTRSTTHRNGAEFILSNTEGLRANGEGLKLFLS
jgi:hypothetical protein